MSQKLDCILIGNDAATLTAALHLAQSGMAVGHLACPSALTSAAGVVSRAILDSRLHGWASNGLATTGVAENRLLIATKTSGTWAVYRDEARLAKPQALAVQRQDLNAWLEQQALAKGMVSLGPFDGGELMHDRSGQLQGFKDAAGTLHRTRALVVGEGAEDLVSATAYADDAPESRVVCCLSTVFSDNDGLLAARIGLEDAQAAVGHMVGSLFGERPGCATLVAAKGAICLTVQMVTGHHDREREATCRAVLEALLSHVSLKALLHNLAKGASTYAEWKETGYAAIPLIYGNGWIMTGRGTRLADPLRHETLDSMIELGATAADAVKRCLAAGDTSARATSVYRSLIDDSFVVQNLKTRRKNIETLEKDPSTVGFYADFFNGWFAHDTSASLEPSRQRNRQFFKDLRNRRPVWEFAMGMRKGLKIMRD